MNKIYLVNHCFDVDGGFGDAIPQEEVICSFDNREDMWWLDQDKVSVVSVVGRSESGLSILC